jgi:hypothetical protein
VADAKSSGLTRGKAILIGVLALVLGGVLYWQFGGSSKSVGSAGTERRGRRAPVATAEAPEQPVVLTATKKNMTEVKATQAVAVVDPAKWKSPPLGEVASYDPFAVPAAFPKVSVAEPMTPDQANVAAKEAQDEAAQRLADAVAQLQLQLEEMKRSGVQVIVGDSGQYAAMIGNRTVHVGDEIDGFTVTEINQSGVHIERKATQ